MNTTTSLPALRLVPEALTNWVRQALAEDIGSGDATTTAIVPPDLMIQAAIRSREPCIVAGLPVVRTVFQELANDCILDTHIDDGQACPADTTIAVVYGPATAILSGERTALNCLQRLSGIATMTQQYVQALASSATRLLDTRKTTPGWRVLEKYAVTAGGGHNHRFGLYDRIMIKDNHLLVAALTGPDAISRAVQHCRDRYPHLDIEVEADTLEQVSMALAAKADYILLDNMSNAEMAAAVTLRNDTHAATLLEASGMITIERLPSIATLGIDAVSVGALTHSVKAIDIGLDIQAD